MDFAIEDSVEQSAFREEVRTWLKQNIPEGTEYPVDPGDLTLRFSSSFLHDLADKTADDVLEIAGQPVSEALLRRAAPDVLAAGEALTRFVRSLGG